MSTEPSINDNHDERPEPTESAVPTVIVCGENAETREVAAILSASVDLECVVFEGVSTLRHQLVEHGGEVIVLAADRADEGLAQDLKRLRPHLSIVAVSSDTTIEEVTRAMRTGVVDFIAGDFEPSDVQARIFRAAERTIELRSRDLRNRRLGEIARRIEEVTDGTAVDAIPDVPEVLESDDSTLVDRVSMQSEFRTLLRQELDVEDLLRTALEYILAKTGPTNAAVFLAGGDGRFGLGAYVNYEYSRRLVEPLLQRLCDEVSPRLIDESELLRFEDASEFISDCDLDAEVHVDQDLVAVPCHHEGECLAVVYFFRRSEAGFSDETADLLNDLRQILAEQIATLIRIHNRMEADWPEDPADVDEDADWDDLAA